MVFTHDTQRSQLLGPSLVTGALKSRITAPLVDVQPPVVEVVAATKGVIAGEVVWESDTGVGVVSGGVADELSEAVGRDVRLNVAKGGFDIGCGLDIGYGGDNFVTDVEAEN